MKTLTKLSLGLSVLLLLSSCNDYDYEIGIGEKIVLDMDSPFFDSGFGWCWDNRDDILIEDTDSWEFIPYDTVRMNGSGGIERLTFIGAHKGITVIQLYYKQPWKEEYRSKREYSVKVD